MIILSACDKFYIRRGAEEGLKRIKNADLKRLLPEYISYTFPSNGDRPFTISYNIVRLHTLSRIHKYENTRTLQIAK